MPPAARVTDPTSHTGTIIKITGAITGPGVPNVLIGGMPAAVMLDTHTCALTPVDGGPHIPTLFLSGSKSVLIGGRPALRMFDLTTCGAPIVMGMPTVLIGG